MLLHRMLYCWFPKKLCESNNSSLTCLNLKTYVNKCWHCTVVTFLIDHTTLWLNVINTAGLAWNRTFLKQGLEVGRTNSMENTSVNGSHTRFVCLHEFRQNRRVKNPSFLLLLCHWPNITSKLYHLSFFQNLGYFCDRW